MSAVKTLVAAVVALLMLAATSADGPAGSVTEMRRRGAAAPRRAAAAELVKAALQAWQRENAELARRQIAAAAVALPRDTLRSGGLGPEMITIASGRFQYYYGYRSYGADLLVEWVEFDAPFAISKYEITRGEFERFVTTSRYRASAGKGTLCAYGEDSSWRRPRLFDDPRIDHPVVCVSHRDAMAYTEWLSEQTGRSYRLPSAAEWQYAARAGSLNAALNVGYGDGAGSCGRANLGEREDCRDGVLRTAEVGRFAPNPVGVHDMIGNVAELVLACGRVDRSGYTFREPEGLPENLDGCNWVAAMGGAYWGYLWPPEWTDYRTAHYMDVSEFDSGMPMVGFRVVRDLHD